MNKKEIQREDIIKNMVIGQPEILEDTVIIDNQAMSIDKAIQIADNQIDEFKKVKSAHVHFSWNQNELERCKRIAEKKGLKYQSYIKSVLKQAMDKDDIAS